MPLVGDHHVALLGRRDDASDWHGHAAFAKSSILDVPSAQLQADDWLEVARDRARSAWRRRTCADSGFRWTPTCSIRSTMAAVDSPEPGGPTPRELLRVLTPLVQHPRALGLSLTMYDPAWIRIARAPAGW